MGRMGAGFIFWAVRESPLHHNMSIMHPRSPAQSHPVLPYSSARESLSVQMELVVIPRLLRAGEHPSFFEDHVFIA